MKALEVCEVIGRPRQDAASGSPQLLYDSDELDHPLAALHFLHAPS